MISHRLKLFESWLEKQEAKLDDASDDMGLMKSIRDEIIRH